MQLTKAEMKTALQAMLDLKHGAGKFTVGDGVEFVCSLADTEAPALKQYHIDGALISQSIFYGTLKICGTHQSRPAQVEVTHSMLQTQVENLWSTVVAASVTAGVQRTETVNEVVFAYTDGADAGGTFHGYKFEVSTTLALDESGKPALDGDGQPYNSNP